MKAQRLQGLVGSWIAVLFDSPPDAPTLPSMSPLATLLLTSLLGLASWRLLRA